MGSSYRYFHGDERRTLVMVDIIFFLTSVFDRRSQGRG